MNLLSLAPASDAATALSAPIELANQAAKQYSWLADFLMKIVSDLLHIFHLEHHQTLFIAVYAIVVFLISFLVGYVLQWIVVKISRAIAAKCKSGIYTNLLDERFFTRVCRIIPGLLFLILIQYTLAAHAQLAEWLTRFTWIYVILLLCIALGTLVNVMWDYFDTRENKRKLPLRGIASLIKGIVWIVAVIIIVAILVNKSPANLLAGVGAFAAVLMLVFKDSIMGVVAGVQLSENDSLHEGDWIAAGNANGVVEEVTLTQVKIQNWDKTVTTLPPYSLVSNGFKNYRNMEESNTRLVQRCYLIDSDSVVETDEAMLDDLAKIPLMTDWITKKRAQQAAGKVENVLNSEGLVDGTIETNLGAFRAYLQLYLLNNPNVAPMNGDGFTYTFVTTLPQTTGGIPLQLYFFTSTSRWIAYEGIMADIYEHIAVMMKKFKLYTFEYPTGRDTLIDGILTEGKTPPQGIFGLPEGLISQSPAN